MALTMTATGPEVGAARCVGSQSALEQLLERTQPQLVRFVSSRIAHDRRDSVVSDVFHAAVVAHQNGKEVTEAWLMTVARNKLIDEYRRTSRNDRLMVKMRRECPVLFGDDPQTVVETDVMVTLDRIKPRYRSILVRHYVNGTPVANMAREDGLSHSAMESALARARSAFRRAHERIRCSLQVDDNTEIGYS